MSEPLRDQIFAACGYAFAVAALTTGLLSPRLGRLTLAVGVVLALVLIPVNVSLIRRFARLRRSLAAHQDAASPERRARPTR